MSLPKNNLFLLALLIKTRNWRQHGGKYVRISFNERREQYIPPLGAKKINSTRAWSNLRLIVSDASYLFGMDGTIVINLKEDHVIS